MDQKNYSRWASIPGSPFEHDCGNDGVRLEVMSGEWIAICCLIASSGLVCAQEDPLHQASASMTAQQYDEAMGRFESVLAADPRNQVARAGEVDAASKAALSLRSKGETDEALSHLLRAAKIVPDDATLLFDLGVLENQMELNKDAEESLHKSILLRPGDPMTMYAIARVKMDLQQLPEAEAAMRGYLRLRPNDPGAHYGLGRILQIGLRNNEAVDEFNKSIALKPEQTESYFELGEVALQDGTPDAAEHYYLKCLARDPNHGGALTGMGILEFRKKQYGAAADYLEHSVRVAPQFQTAHYYYGLTLSKLGRKEEADSELALATKMATAENARKNQRLAPASQ
jgi:tetratricopeptide (TPR) repeat protein